MSRPTLELRARARMSCAACALRCTELLRRPLRIAPIRAPHSRADCEDTPSSPAPAGSRRGFLPDKSCPASSRGAVGAAAASCVVVSAFPSRTDRVGPTGQPCSHEPGSVEARAGLFSRKTRARRNHPLTLLLAPPSVRDELGRFDVARSREPFRPRAAKPRFPRAPKTPFREQHTTAAASRSRSAFRR